MDKTIEFQNTISVRDFCALREVVGFQQLTEEQAQKVLDNTTFLVHAVCDGTSVGIVRTLTDWGTDAYITDVIVHPQFQGMGIGRKMIERMIQCLREQELQNVTITCSLYANPGKETFYERFGFKTLPNGRYGCGMLLEL